MTVSLSDLNSGKLQYFAVPVNQISPVFATFSFRVQDDGGTAIVGGVQGFDTIRPTRS